MLGNLSNCIAPSNLQLSSNSITTARPGTVEAFSLGLETQEISEPYVNH